MTKANLRSKQHNKSETNKEPSLRDKLSANFLKAFESDFEANGVEVIKQLREKSPEKYAEIASRLIAAAEPKSDGFESCNSHEEIGRKLLQSIGFAEPDDASIQAAVELNNTFIDGLQRVRAEAEGTEGVMQ